MKHLFQMTLLLFCIFLFSGCANQTIENRIREHDVPDIAGMCSEMKEDSGEDKCIEAKTETIEAYTILIHDFEKEENIDAEEMENYIKEITVLKNNYEFIVSTNDSFSRRLNDFIRELNELKQMFNKSKRGELQ